MTKKEEIKQEVRELAKELGLTDQQVYSIIEHIKKTIESGDARIFYEKSLGGIDLASLLGSEKWLGKEGELQALYEKIYRLLKM